MIAQSLRSSACTQFVNHTQRFHGRVSDSPNPPAPGYNYPHDGRAKLQVGLAKGKKQHDKRAVEKDRDWQRDKARLLRRG